VVDKKQMVGRFDNKLEEFYSDSFTQLFKKNVYIDTFRINTTAYFDVDIRGIEKSVFLSLKKINIEGCHEGVKGLAPIVLMALRIYWLKADMENDASHNIMKERKMSFIVSAFDLQYSWSLESWIFKLKLPQLGVSIIFKWDKLVIQTAKKSQFRYKNIEQRPIGGGIDRKIIFKNAAIKELIKAKIIRYKHNASLKNYITDDELLTFSEFLKLGELEQTIIIRQLPTLTLPLNKLSAVEACYLQEGMKEMNLQVHYYRDSLIGHNASILFSEPKEKVKEIIFQEYTREICEANIKDLRNPCVNIELYSIKDDISSFLHELTSSMDYISCWKSLFIRDPLNFPQFYLSNLWRVFPKLTSLRLTLEGVDRQVLKEVRSVVGWVQRVVVREMCGGVYELNREEVGYFFDK
jgi:hypothetical protein